VQRPREQVDAAIRYRQVKAACHSVLDAATALFCLHQRRLGDVNRSDGRRLPLHLQTLGKLRGIVALAAAGIQYLHAGYRHRERCLDQRLSHRSIMAVLQKAAAGQHHGFIIAVVLCADLLGKQQIDIAAAGKVEAVPVRAAQRISFAGKNATAVRAAKKAHRTRSFRFVRLGPHPAAPGTGLAFCTKASRIAQILFLIIALRCVQGQRKKDSSEAGAALFFVYSVTLQLQAGKRPLDAGLGVLILQCAVLLTKLITRLFQLLPGTVLVDFLGQFHFLHQNLHGLSGDACKPAVGHSGNPAAVLFLDAEGAGHNADNCALVVSQNAAGAIDGGQLEL